MPGLRIAPALLGLAETPPELVGRPRVLRPVVPAERLVVRRAVARGRFDDVVFTQDHRDLQVPRSGRRIILRARHAPDQRTLPEPARRISVRRDPAADEIVVSDGGKSDSANLQEIFASDAVVALMDPVYPVYADSNVVAGRSGPADASGRYAGMVYLPCVAENAFQPALPDRHVDL